MDVDGRQAWLHIFARLKPIEPEDGRVLRRWGGGGVPSLRLDICKPVEPPGAPHYVFEGRENTLAIGAFAEAGLDLAGKRTHTDRLPIARLA